MKTINKSILFILFFLFYSFTVFAQKSKIDSLKIELQIHKEKDSIRVELLIDLAIKHINTNYETTTAYLNESETLARVIDYKMGIARSIYFKGLALVFKSDYQDGDQYYKQAIELFEGLNATKKLIFAYSNMGVFYARNRDYRNAIVYYKKALDYKDQVGDNNAIKELYFIGRAYYKIGDFKNALIYYKKALHNSEQLNDTKQIESCLTCIGDLYSHQGNYPLALDYLNKSLDLAKKHQHIESVSDALVSLGNVYIRLQNYDKAIEYHQKALIESNKVNDRNLATISHNLGESYKYKKDNAKALEFFRVALEKFKERKNRPDEAETLNKIGEIYLEQKNQETAYKYFENAKNINIAIENRRGLSGSYLGLAKVYFNQKKYSLALSNTLDSKKIAEELELIDVQKDAEQLLSKVYTSTSQYKKALISHQQFKILNDSLFNKENIEKITQIEYEYKYKQALDSASIRELKLTKTVQATSQDLEKSQRNYLWAIIGFLLVSIILGSTIFYQKFKTIKVKNQTIATEQKLLRSQMTPHFIFNSLSVLQGMILNKEDKKSVSYLSKFSRLMRITLENSRDKLVLLSQELLAVENYLELQNLENASYKYSISVDDAVNSDVFQIPPMLIQPFVENAIEHAFTEKIHPKTIDIKLNYSNKNLICTIADNGIGISARKENKNGHKTSLATTITSERLQILSKDLKIEGSVTIEDRAKYNAQGTLVTLVIPHKIVEVS